MRFGLRLAGMLGALLLLAAGPPGPARAQDLAEAAEPEWRAALEADPRNQERARDAAFHLLETGRESEAVGVLERAGCRGTELGEAYVAAGQPERAAAVLREALDRGEPAWVNRMLLGLLAQAQSRFPEAVEHYWQALSDPRCQPSVHLLMGRALAALAELSPHSRDYFFERAEQEFQQAMSGDASQWTIHRDRAHLLEKRGAWARAYAAWQSVKSVSGKSREVAESLERLAALAGIQPKPRPSPSPAGVTAAPPLLRDVSAEPIGTPRDPWLTVGLTDRLTSCGFGATGDWTATDADGRTIWTGAARRPYRVRADAGGRFWLFHPDGRRLKPWPKQATIEPVDRRRLFALINSYQPSGYVWAGGVRNTRYYRGQLRLVQQGGKLRAINRVRLEDYLAGVVPAEMPASWPLEALKAQAVAARTDTLRRRGTHRAQGFMICNTPHCAHYEGANAEDPRSLEAVRATAGQVLYAGERLCGTFYSHACGGATQSYEQAWGTSSHPECEPKGVLDSPDPNAAWPRPRDLRAWLRDWPEAWCARTHYSGSGRFRWLKIMTPSELDLYHETRYALGNLREIRVLSRGPQGYVNAVALEGSRDTVIVRKDQIRGTLGALRSNLFYVLPVRLRPQGEVAYWLFFGGGWGHGVGFCQAGAAAMAENQKTYREILTHYFPDSELRAWQEP